MKGDTSRSGFPRFDVKEIWPANFAWCPLLGTDSFVIFTCYSSRSFTSLLKEDLLRIFISSKTGWWWDFSRHHIFQVHPALYQIEYRFFPRVKRLLNHGAAILPPPIARSREHHREFFNMECFTVFHSRKIVTKITTLPLTGIVSMPLAMDSLVKEPHLFIHGPGYASTTTVIKWNVQHMLIMSADSSSCVCIT